ncbi:uncharacterized protein ACNS7B_004181 isoform 2-T2 [Menidia menidia]
MNMWLKQATLVLLTVTGAAVGMSLEIKLTNPSNPRKEKVPLGSSLTLICSLGHWGGTSTRYRVNWTFTSFVSNETRTCRSMFLSNYTEKPKQESCQGNRWTLLNVNETNSGYYCCEITSEIPILISNKSDTKEIVVVKPSDWTPHAHWWIWVLVGVSSLFLLILLVLCALHKQRARSEREEPVYANNHHKRRSVPEVDNLKTVPTSHHYRTPSPSRRYEEGQRRNNP